MQSAVVHSTHVCSQCMMLLWVLSDCKWVHFACLCTDGSVTGGVLQSEGETWQDFNRLCLATFNKKGWCLHYSGYIQCVDQCIYSPWPPAAGTVGLGTICQEAALLRSLTVVRTDAGLIEPKLLSGSRNCYDRAEGLTGDYLSNPGQILCQSNPCLVFCSCAPAPNGEIVVKWQCTIQTKESMRD